MKDQTITRTLAEITAMSLKATRGAGCEWGLAEDAALAVRALCANGFPGVTALAHLLQGERNCPCHPSEAAPACGIWTAACLSDRLDDLEAGCSLAIGAVAWPLLVAGAAAQAARRTGKQYEISWDACRIWCGPSALCVVEGSAECDIGEVSIRAIHETRPDRPEAQSRRVDRADWERLETHAHKTYVPETDASKTRGAGPSGEDDD